MCSTTTIIYIVIAFIVLIFIYNYMKKKSEALAPFSLFIISNEKCVTQETREISSQLQDLEDKIKTNIGADANSLKVSMSRLSDSKYIIEFKNCQRLDLPTTQNDMNKDDVYIYTVRINDKWYRNTKINIGPELKAIKNAANNDILSFEPQICNGCADSIIINLRKY